MPYSGRDSGVPPPRSKVFDRGQVLGIGTPVDINVTFADAEHRRRVEVAGWRPDGDAAAAPRTLHVFDRHSPVSGEIIISTDPDHKVEYQELSVALIGEQTTLSLESRKVGEFLCHVAQLEKGVGGRKLRMDGVHVVPYAFPSVAKDIDSYYGFNVRVRWLVRVVMRRARAPDVIEEQELWVENPTQCPPRADAGMHAEVGVDNCLHILFDFNKRAYHLREVVKGRILFHMVNGIRLNSAELSVVCRETVPGAGIDFARTVGQLEVMDGHPGLNRDVPLRLHLGAFALTPTIKDPDAPFTVRYFLNVVLLDSADRRYYKQLEVHLWRKGEDEQQT
eukprot:TRINITY_DN2284_c0_g1_i1.p1 TRINITY_DN2284_c0_g1~~TRINITY_DN2284_c0_g1_i1.p1  ORF type:complete len:352 (+),score=131.73 TRINITY_DN2284_c0_g1_i1:54-1058(+)